MSESSQGAGPTQRSVEIGVVLFTIVFALIVIVGSLQVGINWGAEGPRAGFFPFYIGLLILISSIVNLLQVFAAGQAGRLFADWGQLRQVLKVVVPTTIYVGAIPWIGIYLASALLIAAFMRWLGRYSWLMVIAIAVGVPVVTFFIFEKWFLVPLPKGPIEDFLHL